MTRYDEDDGRPVSRLLSETRPKARKDHDCSTCSRGVAAGQRYRRRFFLVDGEAFTEKVCGLCEAELGPW